MNIKPVNLINEGVVIRCVLAAAEAQDRLNGRSIEPAPPHTEAHHSRVGWATRFNLQSAEELRELNHLRRAYGYSAREAADIIIRSRRS